MNFLFSTNRNATAVDMVLLLLRLFIGVAMMTHGLPKLEQLMAGNTANFPSIFGLSIQVSMILAILAEVGCSLFLILGLFSRPSAFILLFTMAVAAFAIHSADSFDIKEKALLYLAIYAVLLCLGPGRFSIDQLISGRKKSGW
ncbi:DoxX family protein [Cruoricaptor ignavus]|uniref:DoxX family protein n=1 Tax=Cruoricaptor ignavus TaxID=1118202 RepID=A0A7M1T2A2_9FLAO|nr:DoxX family protein [Cruoricaptor ignavus]QOR73959.1 DoxX family protein [Cruoricaptor ignavus]